VFSKQKRHAKGRPERARRGLEKLLIDVSENGRRAETKWMNEIAPMRWAQRFAVGWEKLDWKVSGEAAMFLRKGRREKGGSSQESPPGNFFFWALAIAGASAQTFFLPAGRYLASLGVWRRTISR